MNTGIKSVALLTAILGGAITVQAQSQGWKKAPHQKQIQAQELCCPNCNRPCQNQRPNSQHRQRIIEHQQQFQNQVQQRDQQQQPLKQRKNIQEQHQNRSEQSKQNWSLQLSEEEYNVAKKAVEQYRRETRGDVPPRLNKNIEIE